MVKTNEKNGLEKRWTWFLFAGANILVVIGCAITWALFAQETINVQLLFLPTLICNLLAIVLCGVFMYFEMREIGPKAMHYQKKWLKFYLVAISLFIVAVLFCSLYFLCFLNQHVKDLLRKTMGWQFWVYFTVTMVITLVAIGFQRYARFRIDLDVYRRRHGENPNASKENNDSAKDGEKSAKKVNEKPFEKDDTKKPSKPTASSGLLDQM